MDGHRAWKKPYEQEFLYAGPLFIHELAHVWIELRGFQGEYMRARDHCFEDSRRAACVQLG